MSEALKDRNSNPWYVLATIYGEQAEDATIFEFNRELAVENRRAWNGWMCAGLTRDALADRARKTEQEVTELTSEADSILYD
ncbi:MAG: hypothetical protein Q9M48_06655 [Rhodobacterales bacterium]|nr:hypothetical protein [Rhodobacterales bacterium]